MSLRIAMAAGGTAGHLEPALNLADTIMRAHPDAQVTVIGGTRGLESQLVPARGYRLLTVPAVALPRRPSLDLLRLLPQLRSATAQARAHLDAIDADVVVGFGGYAAVPTYLAARRRRTPIIVHEANARAGIANRLAARFTPHLFAMVPGAMPNAEVIGVPLRPAIATLDRRALRSHARAELGLSPDAPVLLVFGGSQGAQHLNAALAGALPALLAAGIEVLHGYGPTNAAPPAQPGYVALPYLDRMDLAYAAADLVVSRAGAMTCGELAAVGLPAIYVPLPIGNGEQRLNALPVVRAGGGIIVDNADLTSDWLAREVPALMLDRSRLEAMGAAAAAYGVRDADTRLLAVIEAVTGIGETGY